MVSRELTLTRLDDWRARLAAEMDRQRREPCRWGVHDCVLGLATGIVEAITGTDLARGYRGKYRTPKGAAKLLADHGAETLGDFVAQFLPEVHPAFAQVGDLGVIPADGPIGEALCMFDASGLVVMTEDGHGRRPRGDAIRAFRVGE